MAVEKRPAALKKDWSYYLGLALLGYSFLPYCVLIVLPFLGMTLAQSGAFAIVFIGTGEIAFLISAALLGKTFVHSVKKRIMDLCRRDHVAKPVGRTRYRIGLWLFTAGFLPHYAVLVDLLFFSPGDAELEILAWLMLAGEAACMISLVLLGPQFWERLRLLFVYPEDEKAPAPNR